MEETGSKTSVTILVKNHYKEPFENKPYQVWIMRGKSLLANPFEMKFKSQKPTKEERDAERNRVCDEYQRWFDNKVESKDEKVLGELRRLYKICKQYRTLELFCCCAPKRCHGETIREFLLKYFKKEEK